MSVRERLGAARFYAALLAGRFVRAALRAARRNATYLPGVVALRVCPDFLARADRPGRVIAVTGTNGKTTVCNLLIDTLGELGEVTLSNRLGSNTASGIAASLLTRRVNGKNHGSGTAVFEIDERSSAHILPFIKPDFLIITNLFRDSIMRNAHPEYIAGVIGAAIPGETKLILNGDDIISSGVSPGNPRVYFGIERLDGDVGECRNLIDDAGVCPSCGGPLAYERRRYHHIGRAVCERCGFRSPALDYEVAGADFTAMEATFVCRGEEVRCGLLNDSVFNVYNQLTVMAALCELGYSGGQAAGVVERAEIIKSRYSLENAGGVTLVMQMAKDRNALACSRAFDYVGSRPGAKEIILMMNNLHDSKNWSENVCWLYDCDFEFLNTDGVRRIVATGPRAKDYYLRLLYAGVPEDKLRCCRSETDAPALLEYGEGESVYILYGTDAIELANRVRAEAKRLAEVARHRDGD
jgi:UDP-N-acetylmuramoyl-L-alanyl-D-glutamate--2,6-diaminopimelate ligase